MLASIHWRELTSFTCWQVETRLICMTVTPIVIIGITADPKIICPKICTAAIVTSNSYPVPPCDRVFFPLIHTEQERVGVTLRDIIVSWWAFPFSCREATKDEIFGSLDNCQSPSLFEIQHPSQSLFVTTSMEIIVLPSINGSIIYPLESSLRILVSNEFDDHLTMGGGPKGLRISKIC